MDLKKPIYLDHNATTPLDPRVLEAMLPYFRDDFGNAASISHIYGHRASAAVDKARAQVANLIGAESSEIIFTSGATESDNIALKGIMENYSAKGNHLITASTEHKAVLDTAKYLESKGCRLTVLKVDKYGQIDPDELSASITSETVLISLMFANNEIGTLHPIKKIGEIADKHGVIFHCDATQAVGKIPIDVGELGIHLMSISAHKMYGPKGVGALYVRSKKPRVKALPIIHGGGHERGMRSGTLNVPGIVGLGAACEIAGRELPFELPREKELRDSFEQKILSGLQRVYINGHPTERTPNTSNISFEYIEGESLMLSLKDDIAVSSGSACTSASLEPSYVMVAIGVPDMLSHSSIRFSLGRFTTKEDMDYAAEKIISAVNHLRELSPLYEMAQKGINLDSIQWPGNHHH